MNAKLPYYGIIILFALIIPYSHALSQKESNIWYFGNNAGLDFSTSPPTSLTNGKMSSVEGCATICSNKGDLLFYTDGVTIWDKRHEVMENGSSLNGKKSAAQTGLSVKQPNNPNRYYVFSIPEVESSDKSCYYSVVDITRNNFNGAVVEKNILVDNPSTEKIAAINHCNGIDVWIILHNEGTIYKSFLLTENGLNLTPTISNGNLHFNINSWAASGYMKFSPVGNMIATCKRESSEVELADFNTSTGSLTNFRTLIFTMLTYGVEFSPNQNFLYVSCGTSQYNGVLYQVDLRKGDNYLNKTLIFRSNDIWYGALQLAPDSSIYLALWDRNYLGVIRKPNSENSGCDFVLNGLNLGTGKSTLGLPTIFQSFLPQQIGSWKNKLICYGSSVVLTNDFPDNEIEYEWTPSDGLNATNISDPTASPITSTLYKIVMKKGGCFLDSASAHVFVRMNKDYGLSLTDSNSDYLPGDTVDIYLTLEESIKGRLTVQYDPHCLLFIYLKPNPNSIQYDDSYGEIKIVFDTISQYNTYRLSFTALLPPYPDLTKSTDVRLKDYEMNTLCSNTVIKHVSVPYSSACAWNLRGVRKIDKLGMDITANSVIVHSGFGGKNKLSVYTLTGDVVWEHVQHMDVSRQYEINLPDLMQGLYIIRINNNQWKKERLYISP